MSNSEDESIVASGDEVGMYPVLRTASFDPKLRFYWFWQAALLMVVTIVGVVLVPFWVLGVGQLWTRKLFESMAAELTERSLDFRKGIFFKIEKTIPLEQIQDLTVREGPLLKALGMCSLSVETAGQNVSGGGVTRLVGIQDARGFRNAVLARRDAIRVAGAHGQEGMPDSFPDGTLAVLEQIRDDVAALRAHVAAESSAASE